MPEKFEPRDCESYEDLPEEEKENFKKVDDGFVGKEALSEDEALEQAEKMPSSAEAMEDKQEKIDKGEAGDYDEADKLDGHKAEFTEKELEKKIIDSIKKRIIQEKICSHSPYFVLSDILGMLPNIENCRENINILKSIFKNGIWSQWKISLDRSKNRNRIKSKSGYGAEAQNRLEESSLFIMKSILSYIKREREKGLEDIEFDLMVKDDVFRKNVLDGIKKFSHHYGGRADDFVEMILNRKETKEIFLRLKQKNWEDKWFFANFNWAKNKEESALIAMSFVFFGRNFVSTQSPDLIKENFLDNGTILEPEYDYLGILVKVDNLRTFSLSSRDLGIANKIPLKNFIAVVIKKNVKDLPKEVLDIIPKHLPVITTDFRVIRIPEKVEKEENEDTFKGD